MHARLLLGFVALVAVPLLVRLATHGAMPDDWGTFPPPRSPGVPGFNYFIFVLGLALALPILGVLLAPRRFGFRATAVDRPRPRAALPRLDA